MKKLIFLFFCLFRLISAQDATALSGGPIKGYAFFPDGVFISNSYSMSRSDSYYDVNGDNHSYYLFTGGLAKPVENLSINTIVLQSRIYGDLGVTLTVPVVISHTADINAQSGWEGMFNGNKSGEQGLSDIWAEISYMLLNEDNTRLQLLGGFKFSTGTFPENIPSTAASSTGSGYNDIEFGLSADYKLFSGLLTSFRWDYRKSFSRYVDMLTTETIHSPYGDYYDRTYMSRFDVNPGGRSHAGLNFIYNIGNLAVGAGFIYSSSSETEVGGAVKVDTDNHYLILNPAAAYRLFDESFPLEISVDYAWMASGKNVTRFHTLSFAISKSIRF